MSALVLYLVCGVAFGFVTEPQDYMCSSPTEDTGPSPLVEAPWGCFPIRDAGDRARWIAATTPAWLPLVVRSVVRGDGIAIGTIVVGH